MSQTNQKPKTRKNRSCEDKRIAVLDFETDSFEFGKVPRPFAADIYYGEEHHVFWGRDCVEGLMCFLQNFDEPLIIYAHNGGKFDFFFLMMEGYLENPVQIVNGRILKAACGIHELRDSYGIIPVPLSAYKKDEISYELFKEGVYQNHREEITKYLIADCDYLYTLVTAFVSRFGLKLTIASTAMEQLKTFHPFLPQNSRHDEKIRPYYFGGRVECFKKGIIEGDFKVYDVNSMYPYVMKEAVHPTGYDYVTDFGGDLIDTKTGFLKEPYELQPYFIKFRGKNKGALPSRTKQGLDFNIEYGEFFSCSHEIIAALKYNLIEIEEVLEIHISMDVISFGDYVDNFVAEKIQAKHDGDKVKEIFAKLLLNSAYGKFAQSPDNFKEYYIRMAGQPLPLDEQGSSEENQWELVSDFDVLEVWERPSQKVKTFFDVATAASITSAARAVLLEGIGQSKGLLYCDTDSLICEELNQNLDEFELGAWKLEAEGNKLAVAGKKLYALFNGEECVKLATKGVRLSAKDIAKVAAGDIMVWENPAPSFNIRGVPTFISRSIKATV